MSELSRAEKWNAEAAAMQAKAGPTGVATREQLAALSGLEFFAEMAAGRLPSPHIGALMGMMLIEFEAGRLVFQGTPSIEHYNPIGAVHGGYVATLLDSCVGCAVHTMLPAGRGYTTLELKINYLRGLTTRTGPVRAEGRVISVGNQVGVAEGKLTDAEGRLYAVATTTCLIFAI